jgi:tetratricopeptide (TPR) repeat protein
MIDRPGGRGKRAHRAPDRANGSAGSESEKRRTLLVCALLALGVLVVYSPALYCDFVRYDDPDYVTSNPVVRQGLTLAGIRWAFTTGAACNWHPVTWLSHMLDVQLFGLKPAGHHLTSLLLHAANSVLLFLLLRRLTAAFWRSAMVAALFALHPLRVESVVWISERKDVLSTLFWLLSVWFYADYVGQLRTGKTAPGVSSARKSGSYWLSLASFALGLMCKPMVVTLPLILLLLDWWPLGRCEDGQKEDGRGETGEGREVGWGKLVREKTPFFALAMASALVTFLVQQQGGSVMPVDQLPIGARVANAFVSYARYLGKTFWPVGLSVFYPQTAHWPAVAVGGAILLLAAITWIVILRRRTEPYLAVGWFWFLVMLLPAIGLVQVGMQAMADRYTYLPMVGVWIMVVWGVHRWLISLPNGGTALAALGGVAVAACVVLTPRQVLVWKNSETLFRHALDVTEGNYFACNNLGNALLEKGDLDGAIALYQQALAINPDVAPAHKNLGDALLRTGQPDQGIVQLRKALQLNPSFAEARADLTKALKDSGKFDEAVSDYNLGNISFQKGQLDDAIAHYNRALDINPDFAEAHDNLGSALMRKGRPDEAIHQFQEALRANPDLARAHNNLGSVLLSKGQLGEAIAHFERALELNPAYVPRCVNLAWLLATSPQADLRRGPQALDLAQRANQASGGGDPLVLRTLAASYAETGQFQEAASTARQALQLAIGQTNSALADSLRTQLGLYQSGSPFRDGTLTNASGQSVLP